MRRLAAQRSQAVRDVAYTPRGRLPTLVEAPSSRVQVPVARSSNALDHADECGCLALVVRFLVWANRNAQ